MYAHLGMGIGLIKQKQKWDRTEVKLQKDSSKITLKGAVQLCNTGFCDKKLPVLTN